MEEFKVPALTVKSTSINSATIKPSKEKIEKEVEQEVVQNQLDDRRQLQIECPYKEPTWSNKPDSKIEYKFEVLKSGSIIEEIDLQSKSYWLFGRLQGCNDIVMAHPTISRFHAVLQYKPKQESEDDEVEVSSSSKQNKEESKFGQGWYIYDLGSTHGTFLNKMKIPPKTYIPVKVGHMIRLGGSTRNYILQGPEFDEEPESELSITELKELRIKQEQAKAKEIELQENMREKEGIDWGMGEDADEETDLSINPYASTNNEELFLEDPKKTLRGFFEREGLELEYKCDEMSAGTFICRVELPIDDMHGRRIVAEVCHKGKKKECVVQCALEACRILDRHGVLRQSHHEPLKRKKPKEDSDEEDDFLDRTGDVERKRQRKLAGHQNSALTYDDLIKQENEILEKIADVESNILKYHEIVKRSKENNENQDQDLDNFMKNLTEDSSIDKTEIRKLRIEEQRLKSEHQKLQKLIKIAKPVNLPPLNNQSSSITETKKKFTFPLFGKRNKLKMNIIRSESKSKPIEKEIKSDEEEIEEDDEIEENFQSSSNKKAANEHTFTQQQSAEEKIKQKDVEENQQKHKNTKIKETKESLDNEEDIPKRHIGPAFIPEDILKNIREQQTNSEEIEESNDTLIENQEESESLTVTTQKEKKKRKSRNRNKGRDNIDIDDSEELEDKTKYSGWLPPENQTGDGMTSLNEKFGY